MDRYGDDGARFLAEEWCRRMTFFYNLALADGRTVGEFKYGPEHVPPEQADVFSAFLAMQPEGSPFQRRAAEILAISPLFA